MVVIKTKAGLYLKADIKCINGICGTTKNKKKAALFNEADASELLKRLQQTLIIEKY